MATTSNYSKSTHGLLSKVPEVTLWFWIVKVLATTLGETGGDALSMSLNLGYAVASIIFLVFFAVTLVVQLRTDRYHPIAYWAAVVATTTVGTTTSDYIDRTLGVGYIASSIGLFALVLIVLAIWKATTGKIEYDHIASPKNEFFYWLTILVSNTLGTALGDFTADSAGIGFQGGALIFGALIFIVVALHYWTEINQAILFWAAYILTRPLGATLGDTLTKPFENGGLNLSRITSSLVIAAAMILIIALTLHKRPEHRFENEEAIASGSAS